MKFLCIVRRPKLVHTISRHVICHTFDEQHTFTWHMHSFLAKDSNFFPREIEHCADPPEVSLGYLVEPTTCAGYEPKDLAGNDRLRVKPLLCNRPSIASTYDSAESTATLPPEWIWTMSKLVLCWLPTVPTRARSKCRPIASLSLCERKLDVKFISRSDMYRDTSRVVFKQNRSNQETSSDRANFPQDINRFWETLDRYSDSLIRQIL